MTFREKVQKEHPEAIDMLNPGGVLGCPIDYGYEKNPPPCGLISTCMSCWDREIPGTEETKEDNRKIDVETVADGIMLIADHYGAENQKKKLIEEMGELIQAVCKDDLPGIIEECADVRVMIQMVYLMGAGKPMDQIMGDKVKRQIERMVDDAL